MKENTVVAVIGCGTIANNAHLPILGRLSGVRLKYAVDIIPERAEKAKAEYGFEATLTDYKEALSDKEVDAVFVLTPNYSHYTVTMDSLGAGKHVFCEKPVTVDYPLSVEMQKSANRNNLILNIGVCNRFHRSVEILKTMADRGDFGEIYHVYCSFRQYRSIPGLGGDFTTKAKSGGGVLIDWGVHFLDLVLYVTGAKVRTVSAECYGKLGGKIGDYVYNDMWAGPPKKDGIFDVEEYVSGFVRTDKASISLNGAWAQNLNENEMYVDFLGDKAGARLMYGDKITVYTVKDGLLTEISPIYNISNMYEKEDTAFLESIKTGVKNKAHIDNVVETAKVMDAIYKSAEGGKEVDL